VYIGTVGIVVPENSTQSVHLTSVPRPTPAPEPTVIVNETGSHSARLSAADRKAAERERQKAERKRARLEAMYQSHLISGAAYKKGQDDYQSEMTKYQAHSTAPRQQTNKGRKTNRALRSQETAKDQNSGVRSFQLSLLRRS
jgi:hypothetical protein